MKKAILLILAAALTLGAFQNSWAAGRTSTSLNNESIMLSNISQPNTGVPLGSVIIWTNNGMPQDAENWRVCNGQSLAGTELCKQTGQCTAPDYRGFFLRGVGGKSGALGAEQKEAIYLPKNSGIKIKIDGITDGVGIYHYASAPTGVGDEAWASYTISSTVGFHHCTERDWSWDSGFRDECRRQIGGPLLGKGSSDDSLENAVSIDSKEKEIRPTNKGVHYLIKVN